DEAVARATSEVVRMANRRSGEGFVAVSVEARKAFWADRARTAAIARHTNAFKINEDVVIPLERMGEYTDGIERINIELSTRNKLAMLDELERLLADEAQLSRATVPGREEQADHELVAERRRQALELVAATRRRWGLLLDQLDAPLAPLRETLVGIGLGHLREKL